MEFTRSTGVYAEHIVLTYGGVWVQADAADNLARQVRQSWMKTVYGC